MNQYSNVDPNETPKGINVFDRMMREIDFELHYSDMFDELSDKYRKQYGEVLDWRRNTLHRSTLFEFQERIRLEPYYNQGVI